MAVLAAEEHLALSGIDIQATLNVISIPLQLLGY
jgi:hypothetical protein